MLSQQFLNIITIIYNKLERTNINWVLTGSTSFAIQGIPLIPNDIDIQTDKEGAYQIQEIFKAYVKTKVSLSSNGKIKSHFGSLVIDGIKVEIMGDIQKNINGFWEEPVTLNKFKKCVVINDMNMPILDLKYEYDSYMKMDRIDRALLLKSWMNQN